MVFAKKYVLMKDFDGLPKRSDYEVVEEELPPLKDGEYLVKANYISVDPYLRLYSSQFPKPYDQFGFQVGTVLESRNSKFPAGSKVVSHAGWRTHAILDDKSEWQTQPPYLLPDLKGLPDSLALGAVGNPGATAYLSFVSLCKPQPGETVVVSGAGGAVGSMVGQIAKVKGCRVIGITGSDAKAAKLKELGFDATVNYKKVDLGVALKEVAPDGIDCYYDNVGGEISSTIMYNMNTRGRVAVVGSVSSYNSVGGLPKATVLQPAIIFKRLKIEGFYIWELFNEQFDAFRDIVDWIKEGKLVVKEHVTEGFDNIFDAFVGMLQGDNFGKAVVKV